MSLTPVRICFLKKNFSFHQWCITSSHLSNYSTFVASKKDLSHPMEAVPTLEVESDWYEWWESNKFFKRKSAEKFSIVLPPPNVTGQLHMGHALTIAIQDAIVRWNQMNGKEVLWIPGCDHGGIATQVVVENYLKKELNISRHQLGRKKFLEHIHQWKEEHGNIIYNQIKRLGASLDWDRTVFTLDKQMNNAVIAAFISLFDAGLIYRDNYIINWCCALQSAISDSEVVHEEVQKPTLLTVPSYEKPVEFGRIYDISYPLEGTSEKVTFSTTRPETLFGDVALMVHPDDARYKYLHKKYAFNPFSKRVIPIVTSEHVSMDKGTGIVKVTPSHSIDDFSVGQKYNLPFIEIIDDFGCIKGVPEIEGMPRFKAREWVLDKVKEMGLLFDCRAHSMAVPRCSRTGDVIENRVKPQWFLKMKELNQKALLAVKEGKLRFHPPHYEKIWNNFLEDQRDWCISRQIWYGHNIPVYWASSQCEDENSGVYIAAKDKDEAIHKASSKLGVAPSEIKVLRPETDVLDTWFSSSLFPFSVFGWPSNTEDFKKYYPTSLLETGHDILYFWVARMVMMGLQLTDKLPFKDVLLHGLICDAHGHKMSKSKGNVINPMDVISCVQTSDNSTSQKNLSFGSDALRFTLCSYNIKQQLISFDMTNVKANFLIRNKIWQAIRFMMHNNEKIPDSLSRMRPFDQQLCNLHPMDRWILSCLACMVVKMNQGFCSHDINLATYAFKNFVLGQLCDIYLEAIKPRLWQHSLNLQSAHIALSILWTCFHTCLISLSPFMPFLSEELYQRLPSAQKKMDSIMQCDYPRQEDWEDLMDESVQKTVDLMLQISSSFRHIISSLGIKKFSGVGLLCIKDESLKEEINSLLPELVRLSNLSDVSFNPESLEISSNEYVIESINDDITIALPIKGLVNLAIESERLSKKLAKLEKTQNNLKLRIKKIKEEEREEVLLKIDSLSVKIQDVSVLLEKFKDLSRD